MEEKPNHNKENNSEQKIYVQHEIKKTTNGIGIAGFITSIFGLILFCVPIISTVFWLLGVVLSIIGMTRKPKSLAIAGLIISSVSFLLWILSLIGLLSLSSLSQYQY